MATFYLYATNLEDGYINWNSLGNWWMSYNAETNVYSVPASTLPSSSDDVIIKDQTLSISIGNNGPNIVINNLTIDISSNQYAYLENITITINNTCYLNNTTLSPNTTINGNCVFTGSATIYQDVIVNGDCIFNANDVYNGFYIGGGIINGNIICNDNNWNTIIIGAAYSPLVINGDLTLNGWCRMDNQTDNLTINGNLILNNISYIESTTLTVNDGTITFNDYSSNYGTITGNCVFNDYSNNGGTITGNCVFNGYSIGGGTITGDCVFNHSSHHNGIIYGIALFKDSSYQESSSVVEYIEYTNRTPYPIPGGINGGMLAIA
jgi:phage gp45-like